MNLYRRNLNKKRGFTLVELVVVIAILAILAAIAVPMVVNIINNASQSAGESNAHEINTQLKSYYAAVVTGNIDQDGRTKSDAGNTIKDNDSLRTKDADTARVEQALKWAGLNSTYAQDTDLTDFYYISGNGTITYVNTSDGQTAPAGAVQLTLGEHLGTIYGTTTP